MKKLSFLFIFVGVLMLSSLASANLVPPVIDGNGRTQGYTLIATQNTQTNFGDNSDGSAGVANGSELYAMYIHPEEDGYIYLFIPGNLETNWKKLDLFIDSGSTAGQNVLRNDNPNIDSDGLNRMAGLTFDTGFTADFYLTFTTGDSGSGTEVHMNYARLETDGGGTNAGYVGGGVGLTIDGTSPDIDAALDNSNTSGVPAGTGAFTPATFVDTGFELKIPKSVLGITNGRTTADIKIVAFINDSGHDFVSNQVLGGIGGGDNLGDPTNVNFANIAGDQFVSRQVTSVGMSEQNTSSMAMGGLWIVVGLALFTVGAWRRQHAQA